MSVTMSPAEAKERKRLKEAHPRWSVELNSRRRWVILDLGNDREELAVHMDIVLAGEVAERTERERQQAPIAESGTAHP